MSPPEAHRLQPAQAPVSPASVPAASARRRWLLGGVLPLLVLALALLAARQLLTSAPQARRGAPPPPQARLVEVISVMAKTHPTQIETVGTVVPARQSILYPQVSGTLIEVAPQLLPGGRVEVGQTLFRIDDSDLQLTVRQRRSELTRAEATVQQERGQQANARAEYRMLGRQLEPEQRALVLREPQMASAQAQLQAAAAVLQQARLDLERSTIIAPFAGMVVERAVDLGTRVTESSQLLTLLDTREFWLRAELPVAQLDWIILPDGERSGSTVQLRNDTAWSEGVYREGEVISLSPDLDTVGRQARLLIRIPDPLALEADHQGAPRVLLNDLLTVEIEGRPLADAVALDRQYLRQGDQVWLLSEEGTLAIRPVEVAFRGVDRVLISQGLETGDRVVTTNLAAAVPGMALRTGDDSREVQP